MNDTVTSQITEVSDDLKDEVKTIADESILNSCRRDGKKLPKDYTIRGFNIVGRVD